MSISPVGVRAAFPIRGLQIPMYYVRNCHSGPPNPHVLHTQLPFGVSKSPGITYGMLARLDATCGVQERAIRIAVELELKRREGKVAKPTRKAKAT
jgi:hypothetical protein